MFPTFSDNTTLKDLWQSPDLIITNCPCTGLPQKFGYTEPEKVAQLKETTKVIAEEKETGCYAS